MTITKSDKTFRELTSHNLDDRSYARMFDILVDHDRYTRFMNIFHSYTFNEDLSSGISYFDTYEVGNDEWWDNISVKYYRTPLLWWVIPAFNKIVNPFEGLTAGENLKVLKPAYILSLLRDLDNLSTGA
jgi:hypothetical protein